MSEGAQRAFGVAGVLALAPFAAEVVAAALEIEPPAAHHLLGELVDYGLLLRPDAEYQVTHALAHTYARTHAKPAAEVIARLMTILNRLDYRVEVTVTMRPIAVEQGG